jgi:hypothetical protein
VSDQRPRAAVLERAGVTVVVDDGSAVPNRAALRTAMLKALAQGQPTVAFDVDGATCTRDLLERLVAGEDPWAPERAS